jgi:hypothetical protein
VTGLSLQPDEAASTDTWIGAAAPTTPHGSETLLHVGDPGDGARRTLIAFDLSEIPADSFIESAVLSLRVQTTSASLTKTGTFNGVAIVWDETTATWIQASGAGPTNWTTPGGDVSGIRDSVSMPTSDDLHTIVDFSVLNNAREAVANLGGLLSLLLIYVTEDGGSGDPATTFNSSSGLSPTNRPKLVVTYSRPKSWIVLTRQMHAPGPQAAEIEVPGVVEFQMAQPGAVAGELVGPGAAVAEAHVPGPAEGQIGV